ncbi:hypothetical protein [Acidisoma sp. S159]|uniref:hypothetical protein n=1 Tax=Acidisoma sp. S159 TaxID=1747225 RepID=UPI001575CF61|nr:hypothetical protein [Acidisoma sp. S159]
MDGFQEFTVIMPWLSPARLRRIKHFQHDRPIALRHSRQHVRLPDTGHAVIRTKPDSGIRQKRMSGIPSTRPSDDGFAVVEAEDGDQAVKQISTSTPFSMLITDIQMPGNADGNVVAQQGP